MSELTPFEKRTREVLEESAGRLDGHTRSRLTRARHAALSRLEKPGRWWRAYLPAGAAAAAAVLTVVIWTGPESPPAGTVAQNGSAFEDIDLLVDAEAPDFVSDAEGLEFYEWVADEIES